MPYRHGVFIAEEATNLVIPIEGSAGLQVIFGTAPIHQLANPANAVNNPIIAYSYKEAVQKLGYSDEWDKFTLCQSIYACFKLTQIAPVILVNVLDPENAEHVIENELTAVAANAFTNNQYKIPDKYALANTVIVKDSTGETTYVRGTDYLLESDGDYVKLTMFSATAKAAVANGGAGVKISSTSLEPSGVDAADIIGAVNVSTGAESGLELIRQIYPRFGMTPGLIVAPGWSHLPAVAAAMQAKCEDINGVYTCECVLDIDSTTNGAIKYGDVKTWKDANSYTGVHASTLWPKVKAGEHELWFSALYAAVTAYIDASHYDVPYLSPSNKPISITGICLDGGAEVILDQDQANLLNGQGISTAININGWRTWGNNTAAYPATTDPKDRWFAVRRMFSWYGNSLIQTYFQKVDDPANYRLIEAIVDSENIRLNSLTARNMIAGGRVEFLQSENPVTQILNGRIIFHVYFAPFTPAEEISFTLEFDPAYTTRNLNGGE